MNPRPGIVPAAVDQLRAELRWLDMLIHRQILRLRAEYQLSLDEFRGLYVSDEQVDALVLNAAADSADLAQFDFDAVQARVNRLTPSTVKSPFAHLVHEFGLSTLEQDILLVVLAPEIESKYETLYAYLNNDVSKKAPTLDLVSRLLGSDEASRLDVRAALMCDSTLLASGLLRIIAGSDQQAWVNSGLKVHRALPGYVLALGYHDACNASLIRSREEREAPCSNIDRDWQSRLRLTARAWSRGATSTPIWLLHGRDATLRTSAASSLCRMFDLDLLCFDLTALPHNHEDLARALRDALLRQRLVDAGMQMTGIDRFYDNDGRLTSDASSILRIIRQAKRPIFIDCETPAQLPEALRGAHVISINVPELDRDNRAVTWKRALDARRLTASSHALENLANGFALMTEQIHQAAQALADELPDDGPPELSPAQLSAAARTCSDQSIARMAQRMTQPFEWKDLVLPLPTIRRLRDIVHAARDRQLVFGDWGLSCRAGGFGLRVLFSGPSGTGKTMAAATIARELEVDIYRIDISQIVSKYIGETEKNLDRVFHAATYSNAILFFDEADALFGKRSEVKDAHDRYSNIETAFLLQRIEEYQGVLFLASNLSSNIDTAFSRRLNFVLEFPLPDKDSRERLWRGMLTGAVPAASDLDIGFLAAQFTLTGGEIQNVVLDASFLAAQDERRELTMKHLVVALGQQLTKQGRMPSSTEFKQYYKLLTEH